MAQDTLCFTREKIVSGSPAERVLTVVGDVNKDGLDEIVVAARLPNPWLVWYERTPSGEWVSHLIDNTFPTLEAGGVLADLTGNGQLDFVGGQDWKGTALYWWECPKDPTERWVRREIFHAPATQLHDQLVADLDGDGRLEVYTWNQGSATLYCAPVPPDPRVEPWPGVYAVVTGVKEEGLAAADVDGDGRDELIAGQSWYRFVGPGRRWERHDFAEGFVSPKLLAADFDGDGRPEIVLSEGDASLFGRRYGRVAHFRAGADVNALWEPTILHDRLLDPHSLAAADFDGDGHLDLFVGEMGDPRGDSPHPPAQRIYLWRGDHFEEQIIDTGMGTHNSALVRIGGKTAIVGKPFQVVDTPFPRIEGIDDLYLWLPA